MTKERIKTLSPYKNNVVASRGKALLTNLADFAMVFLFSFFFYTAIGYPVSTSLSSTKAAETSYVEEQSKLNKITEGLHLKIKDGDSYLGSDAMVRNYLVTLVKTSFYLNNEAYPAVRNASVPAEDETFLNKGSAEDSFPLDNISYYFYTVKGREVSVSSYVYDNVDYSSNKDEALYTKFFAYEDATLFESKTNDLSLYQQLKFESAQILADYMVFGGSSSSEAGKLYSTLGNHYSMAYSKCVDEVESAFEPYVTAMASFNSNYGIVVGTHIIALVLTFVLGWAVNELILPLFFKNHRTLAMKMMRVAYTRTDETEVQWWNALIKSVVRLPLYVCAVFGVMAFLGVQSFSLFSFGGFRFITVLLFSFLALLVSGVMEFILPTRQALGELAGGLLLKDLDFYEAGESSGNKVDEKEDDNGRQSH